MSIEQTCTSCGEDITFAPEHFCGIEPPQRIGCPCSDCPRCRRERIATAAMQGILSRNDVDGDDIPDVAATAVMFANMLTALLDKAEADR